LGFDVVVIKPVPPYTITPHLRRFSLRGSPTPCVYDDALRRCSRLVRVRGCLVAYRVFIVREGWDPLIKVHVLRGDVGVTAEVVKHVLNTEYRYPSTDELISACPGLEVVLRRYPGLRPALNPTMWESLVKAITNQQISIYLALTITSRLVTHYGIRLRVGDGEYLYDFPTPEEVLRAGVTGLRSVGLSLRKAEYVVGIAEAIVKQGYDLGRVAELRPDEAIEELMKFRGVGPWTAKLAYMAYTGNLSILLPEDLAVRKGLEIARCREDVLKELTPHAGLISYLAAFLYEG